MKFVDEVKIEAIAGHGGAGAAHFRREKYVPFGGPDGGNGGKGGSVVLLAVKNKHTLLDFRYNPRWKAEKGDNGEKQLKDGKRGEELIIPVPVGTQVLDLETGELLADLTEEKQKYILVNGGRGGKGNAFFKSATNQVPRHAQPGEEGEIGTFKLSLKVLADIGLVGFPNAGKSTLISRISSAKPKIADYPFTTLVPNLGVVAVPGDEAFVVADIPGLIEGASEGKGLGIRFLKHLERTRFLFHLIDPLQLDESGEELPATEAFDIICRELENFSEDLAGKQQIVLINKIDTIDNDKIEELLNLFKKRGLEAYPVSAVTGSGVEELIFNASRRLKALSE